MRRISAMYQWSGGTDYRHVCKECSNCVLITTGKRSVYKCISYGNSASAATDWNEANIACKGFGKKPPEIPVYKLGNTKIYEQETVEGQINLSEFIKI